MNPNHRSYPNILRQQSSSRNTGSFTYPQVDYERLRHNHWLPFSAASGTSFKVHRKLSRPSVSLWPDSPLGLMLAHVLEELLYLLRTQSIPLHSEMTHKKTYKDTDPVTAMANTVRVLCNTLIVLGWNFTCFWMIWVIVYICVHVCLNELHSIRMVINVCVCVCVHVWYVNFRQKVCVRSQT